MAQLFKNNARAALIAGISNSATTITIDPARADLFPIANTNAAAISLAADWFKATLQNTTGAVEIIYVRTRALGSGVLANVLRAQEGTSALTFIAGNICSLRMTALDVENAMVFENIASDYGKTLVAAESEAGVKFRSESGITVPTTLNAASHAGSSFTLINPVNVILPLAATCGSGAVIAFYSLVDGGSVSIQAPNIFANAVTTTFVLNGNDTLIVQSNANSAWIPIGGSASLKYSSVGTFNGVKFKEQVVISTPTTLTAEAHAGAEITIVGATPVTLPPVSTCPQGSLIQFFSVSGGAFVVPQSGDTFSNNVTTAFNLDANDSLLLMSDGGNNWIFIGGSAVLRYATTTGQRAGEICIFARDTPPLGFLKANGALVSRSSYAPLFSVIGVNFGAGDGSTTFALPDLRGEFIRFWDDGRGIDPGRAIFTFQADDYKSHAHTLTNFPGFLGAGSSGGSSVAIASPNLSYSTAMASSGGTETRPRNVAYLACIKY